MPQFAELVLSARSDGLKPAENDLRQLGKTGAQVEAQTRKSMQGVENSLRGVDGGTKAASASFRQLRQSLDPVYRQSQMYEAAVREVDAAVSAGVASQSQANRVLDLASQKYLGAADSARMAATATANVNAKMSSGAFGLRNFGLQLGQVAQQGQVTGDYLGALAVQSGDMLLGFGALGIALSVVASVMAPFALDLIKSSDAAASLNFNVTALQPVFSGLAAVLAPVGQAIGATFKALAENLDRVVIIAGTAATLFAGKYVAGVVAARVATMTLTGSLLALRGALIRTGLGALIVGAGELVYQFSRLVKATGSFGGAMELLGRVAAGVWEGIKTTASSIPPALQSVWVAIQAGFARALEMMTANWSAFLFNLGAGLQGIPVFEKLASDLMSASDAAADASFEIAVSAGQLEKSSGALKDEAKALAKEGLGQIVTAAEELKSAVSDAEKETVSFNKALEDTDTSAGRASKALEQAKSEAEAYEKALKEAALTAEDIGTEKANILISGIDGVANAFGDFIGRGLTDFKSFAKSILSSFTGMLSQMIALAAKNRIMFNMGITPTGVSGTAAGAAPGAGGGGLINGLIGRVGGVASSFFSGASGLVTSLTGAGGGIGAAGTYLSSVLSGATSSLTGFAAAAGALALPLAAVGAVFSFFKTKTKELDAGMRVSVEGMDALIQGFQTIEKKKFWGLSKKVSTNLTELDEEVARSMQNAIGNLLTGIVDTAGALGVASGVFDDFTTEINVSTKGLSEEEAQRAVADALGILSDQFAGMVPGLLELRREGEGFADALNRLLTEVSAANEAMLLLDQGLFEMSLAGAEAASALVELSGGLDQFTAKTQYVFENMMTSAAQQARLTEIALDRLNSTFGDLQFAVPQTHAEFMALLDAQNLNTEAGRQTYAALMDVAGAFVQVNGTAQQAAERLRADVVAAQAVMQAREAEANQAVADAEAALRAAFAAERDRLTSTYQAQQDAADSLAQAAIALRRSIYDALQDALDRRRATSAAEELMRLSSATAFLRGAVGAGGTDDLSMLEKALGVVEDPSTDLFNSFQEYQHSFNTNTALMERLKDVSGAALSVEERTLGATQSQTSVIQAGQNAQIAALDAQMNALLGIDNSVLSVGAAIVALDKARAAAEFAAGPSVTPATSFQPGSFGAQLDAAFRTHLGRGVRQGAVDYYGAQYQAGRSIAEIEAEIAASPEAQRYRQTGVPKFASGGNHRGGLRIVGERGPELEATGPSRIYSNAQTRSMMDTSRLEAQLSELNERTRYMQDKMKTLARIANDQNINGMPGTREGATVTVEPADGAVFSTEEVV